MDTGTLLTALIQHDKDLCELDEQIGNLQRGLKELKKAREEKVAAMRGTIRDAARPIFQMLENSAQDGAGATNEPLARSRHGRKTTNAQASA